MQITCKYYTLSLHLEDRVLQTGFLVGVFLFFACTRDQTQDFALARQRFIPLSYILAPGFLFSLRQGLFCFLRQPVFQAGLEFTR